MTEAEWLACVNPVKMLGPVRDTNTRKTRLVGCAWCRRVWPLFTDDADRRLVEAIERWPDEIPDEDEHDVARRIIEMSQTESTEDVASLTSLAALCSALVETWTIDLAPVVAVKAAKMAGWPSEEPHQAALMREVYCNPFRPVALDPAWLTPAVLSLAEAAYEERLMPSGHLDTARLAVLADALEDAGAVGEIQAHLRGPGPHMRGCWGWTPFWE